MGVTHINGAKSCPPNQDLVRVGFESKLDVCTEIQPTKGFWNLFSSWRSLLLSMAQDPFHESHLRVYRASASALANVKIKTSDDIWRILQSCTLSMDPPVVRSKIL